MDVSLYSYCMRQYLVTHSASTNTYFRSNWNSPGC